MIISFGPLDLISLLSQRVTNLWLTRNPGKLATSALEKQGEKNLVCSFIKTFYMGTEFGVRSQRVLSLSTKPPRLLSSSSVFVVQFVDIITLYYLDVQKLYFWDWLTNCYWLKTYFAFPFSLKTFSSGSPFPNFSQHSPIFHQQKSWSRWRFLDVDLYQRSRICQDTFWYQTILQSDMLSLMEVM